MIRYAGSEGDLMPSGFDRAQYAWFMDPAHQRAGYGDMEWKSDGTRHEGTFSISNDAGLNLPVEFLLCVNELKSDEPNFVVNLNHSHAARIDVNGWHKFDGERSARQSSHFQYNPAGSDGSELTMELPDHAFPALDRGVNVNFEAQLQQCLRASVVWLNIDLSGVLWTPMPFEGGK